jgi:hypothetical protein
VVWVVGAGSLVGLFGWVMQLSQGFRRDAEPLPVLRMIVAVTLWQAVVGALLTVNYLMLGWDRYALVRGIANLPTVVLALALVVSLTLAVLFARYAIRRHRAGRSIDHRCFVSAVVLIASALLVFAAFRLCPDYLAGINWLPARGAEGMSAEVWRWALKLEDRSWLWAVAQWYAYGGSWLSPGCGLLLVAGWYGCRSARSGGEQTGRRCSRGVWAGFVQCVSRSALAMAVCALAVYLAVAPSVVQRVEWIYQEQMAFARDPRPFRLRVDEEAERIRRDLAVMRELRAKVDDRISQERKATADGAAHESGNAPSPTKKQEGPSRNE